MEKEYIVKVEYRDNEIHCTRWYNKELQLHREDGPAVDYDNGYKAWYINGEFNRENGPAVEDAYGNKFWYINGKLHREGGPAVEYAGGSKEWYLNGKVHREDGPAYETLNGNKLWYIDNKKLTEDQFNLYISSKNKVEHSCISCGITNEYAIPNQANGKYKCYNCR